jgi:hypothetical protein
VRDEEKGEVSISKEDLEANMALLVFAGSELTSTAMAAIVLDESRWPMRDCIRAHSYTLRV